MGAVGPWAPVTSLVLIRPVRAQAAATSRLMVRATPRGRQCPRSSCRVPSGVTSLHAVSTDSHFAGKVQKVNSSRQSKRLEGAARAWQAVAAGSHTPGPHQLPPRTLASLASARGGRARAPAPRKQGDGCVVAFQVRKHQSLPPSIADAHSWKDSFIWWDCGPQEDQRPSAHEP